MSKEAPDQLIAPPARGRPGTHLEPKRRLPDFSRQGRRPARRPRSARKRLPALFAGLVAAGTTGVVILTAILIINPSAATNMFPGLQTPTATAFVYQTPVPPLPPTWTPSPTYSMGSTPTWFPTATWTPFLSEEDVGVVSPPGPTNTVSTSYPFRLADSVQYVANTNAEGCDWMSLAGQIWDQDGNPLLQVGVEVTGESFNQFAWAGSATAFGASGYEILLNTSPYVGTWRVRVLNFNTMPISDVVVVRSKADCNHNVVILNFEQWQDWRPG